VVVDQVEAQKRGGVQVVDLVADATQKDRDPKRRERIVDHRLVRSLM
jgi:hypothetical protein